LRRFSGDVAGETGLLAGFAGYSLMAIGDSSGESECAGFAPALNYIWNGAPAILRFAPFDE
jgi:hypothetical protein